MGVYDGFFADDKYTFYFDKVHGRCYSIASPDDFRGPERCSYGVSTSTCVYKPRDDRVYIYLVDRATKI